MITHRKSTYFTLPGEFMDLIILFDFTLEKNTINDKNIDMSKTVYSEINTIKQETKLNHNSYNWLPNC